MQNFQSQPRGTSFINCLRCCCFETQSPEQQRADERKNHVLGKIFLQETCSCWCWFFVWVRAYRQPSQPAAPLETRRSSELKQAINPRRPTDALYLGGSVRYLSYRSFQNWELETKTCAHRCTNIIASHLHEILIFKQNVYFNMFLEANLQPQQDFVPDHSKTAQKQKQNVHSPAENKRNH